MTFNLMPILVLFVALAGVVHADGLDAAESCACPMGGAPFNGAQVLLVSDVVETSFHGVFGPDGDNLLLCHQNKNNDPNFTMNTLVPATRAAMAQNPPGAGLKDDGTPITQEDWVMVDLLARMLVGEIATKHQCTEGDISAVARVVLNRADFVAHDTTGKWARFASSKSKNNLAQVITHPLQFYSAAPHDNSNFWFNCPSHKILQKYHKGDKTFATGINEFISMTGALAVAGEMIFHPKAFRKHTRALEGVLYYAWGEPTHTLWTSQGYTQIKGKKIGNDKINNINCVELWQAPD